jgi:hypothetical protein
MPNGNITYLEAKREADVKQSERDAELSFPYSPDVKIMWTYTSASPYLMVK